LGAIALPLHLAQSTGEHPIHESFKPNHHIFYDDRVEDVKDDLPKWKTVPQGDLSDADGKNANLTGQPVPGGYDPITGQYNKDVLPLSPTRAPDPTVYHFTEVDPIPNHVTSITTEKVRDGLYGPPVISSFLFGDHLGSTASYIWFNISIINDGSLLNEWKGNICHPQGHSSSLPA